MAGFSCCPELLLHPRWSMSMIAALVLYGSSLYALLGICVAVAFVVLGVTRILPQPATVTMPARLLLFPGAVALWPVVVRRWLQAARARPRT
jgi:hypothetical protein